MNEQGEPRRRSARHLTAVCIVVGQEDTFYGHCETCPSTGPESTDEAQVDRDVRYHRRTGVWPSHAETEPGGRAQQEPRS